MTYDGFNSYTITSSDCFGTVKLLITKYTVPQNFKLRPMG